LTTSAQHEEQRNYHAAHVCLSRCAKNLAGRSNRRDQDTEAGKTEAFVTWSDADVRHYYNRWPLGTRERIVIDVYLFTGLRGDAASFGPADVTEHMQERIGPDG
jgi:hypothetical protein